MSGKLHAQLERKQQDACAEQMGIDCINPNPRVLGMPAQARQDVISRDSPARFD